MILRLGPPDEVTAQALKRLRVDPDFQHVSGWLERALAELDKANRPMIDSVQLRMGQGAALVLDYIVMAFKGGSKGVLADTRGARRSVQSDTARGTSS